MYIVHLLHLFWLTRLYTYNSKFPIHLSSFTYKLKMQHKSIQHRRVTCPFYIFTCWRFPPIQSPYGKLSFNLVACSTKWLPAEFARGSDGANSPCNCFKMALSFNWCSQVTLHLMRNTHLFNSPHKVVATTVEQSIKDCVWGSKYLISSLKDWQ